MAGKALGGGSSAVAASSHAACARFRGTDPLITGMTRRGLAEAVGFRDDFGGIPEARWMRAMTFERLVRDEAFASEVATTTVGRLGLDRPNEVVIVNARGQRTTRTAHAARRGPRPRGRRRRRDDDPRARGPVRRLRGRARHRRQARLRRRRPEDADRGRPGPGWSWATPRTTSASARGSTTRGCSRASSRSRSAPSPPPPGRSCPTDMEVHRYGVAGRAAQRVPPAGGGRRGPRRPPRRGPDARRRAASRGGRRAVRRGPIADRPTFVAHLQATFDPATCPSCTLFTYCRDELRDVRRPGRPAGRDRRPRPTRGRTSSGLVDGHAASSGAAPASIAPGRGDASTGVAAQRASAASTRPASPGTVNVVIAKSDAPRSASTGSASSASRDAGAGSWTYDVFDDPQGAETRRARHGAARQASSTPR